MTFPNDSSASQAGNPFRALPSVSSIIERLADVAMAPELLTQVVRGELDLARRQIQEGRRISAAQIFERCHATIQELESSRFDPVINATGIVLHTNLGRAPVSAETSAAMATAASSYLSLEIDPDSNQRGGRMDEISRLMRLLTGSESTLVVNNNAGAILLTLAALCAERDVVISRGEAVEIGGGVRIPEVIQQSGCRLVEVGTTNRTYLRDYERAFSPETAALLKVHTSNFRVDGFTATVSTIELGALAEERESLLIEDMGSGALLDTSAFGLEHEPTVSEAIGAGASIVTFSGDKLLGGPQSGIISGRADLVSFIERHPLARTLRSDKTTLAGVAATLRHYIRGDAEVAIPIWRMIGTTFEALMQRAELVSQGTGGEAVQSVASIGGGSLPGETMPSAAIRYSAPHPDALAKALRNGSPRVFPIIRDDAVLIDMRAVLPEQDVQLVAAIEQAIVHSARE